MPLNRVRSSLAALESLRPTLFFLLRLLLGGIFVFSGATKLPVHSQFLDIVGSYHLLPESLATAYALVLPWAEVVVGAYLLLGVLVRPSSFAIILMGASFVVGNARAISLGERYCGSCFGESVPLLAWQALVIDIPIMMAALYLVVAGGQKQILSFDSWFASRQPVSTAVSIEV
jgi:uncharacterized membrane protein YphA (DoxX/SURF4 family)